jgi:subtilisin family serine protease
MLAQFLVPEASLGTPADAQGAFAVGAVHWSNDVLEPYSSQGPTNDGRTKPDLVAPTAVKNAAYAPSIFDGTSAATPHVAGAAALLLQAFPSSTPDEIADLLRNRAVKLDGSLNSRSGAGRLNLGALPEIGQ